MASLDLPFKRALALTAVAALVAACAIDPQNIEIKRLERLGFKQVGSAAQPGAPRAMTYSGDADKLVTCSKGDEKIRIADLSIPSNSLPGKTIRQDSTLDSYVVVSGDGTKEGTHILTLVRTLEENGQMVAREVLTSEIGLQSSGELGELGTCVAA